MAPRDTGGLAFVINSGDVSISLLNVATKQEVRRIPTVREPHHMALTPDHRFLVVGDTVANEMVFLDPVTGDVERRVTVSDPYQFGYSPDGKWSVVNGLLRNQVGIFDAATMSWYPAFMSRQCRATRTSRQTRPPSMCHCRVRTALLRST